MIKKAVLLTTVAPFLMVFSSDSYATHYSIGTSYYSTPSQACSSWVSSLPYSNVSFTNLYRSNTIFRCSASYEILNQNGGMRPTTAGEIIGILPGCKPGLDQSICEDDSLHSAIIDNPYLTSSKTDEQCESENGGSISVSASSANYLNNGGSVKTHGGACSITGAGGVTACFGTDGDVQCSLDIVSESTGEYGKYNADSPLNGAWGEGSGTFSVVDFNVPEYLTALPGGCTDSANCVNIGGTEYLVDWSSAPDYFSYVDSNGNVQSGGGSGGGGDNGGDTGGGDTTDPTTPTDPTDPGGDTGGGDSGSGDTGDADPTDPGGDTGGGSSGGGSSGGGSTVPDFEFDESGIIEAIGSAGRSNRNAIDALSTDVTGAISSQTDDLTASNNTQTQTLSNAIADQSTAFTAALDGQTENVTGAIDTQTGALTGSLDALSTSIFDAIAILGFGEGDGEGEEGDGLLGGISNLLNGMVDNLASRFTEDLGTGDDLFNSSGLDDTLDGVAAQEQEHSDEINTLMDEIGDGATSGIADQITSRLPSLPSGSCVPLQFGPMEISCQAFNTIKLWLTWIIYFWTVVSIVDTFFRSEQRTA